MLNKSDLFTDYTCIKNSNKKYSFHTGIEMQNGDVLFFDQKSNRFY